MFQGLEQDFPTGQRRNELIAFVVLCKGPLTVITTTLMGLKVQPDFFLGVFFLKSIKQQQESSCATVRVHILQQEHLPDVSMSDFYSKLAVGAVWKQQDELIWPQSRVCSLLSAAPEGAALLTASQTTC